MRHIHITEKLSAYLNRELPHGERMAIAEHVRHCRSCRAEYDAVQLGAALASNLKRAAAPEDLWKKIENALDGKPVKHGFTISNFSFFNGRGLPAAAVMALLIAFGLIAAVYRGLPERETKEFSTNDPALDQPANTETPRIASTSNENSTKSNIIAQISPITNSNIQNQSPSANSNQRIPSKIEPPKNPSETIAAPNNSPAWTVETISGAPRAGSRTISENGKLAVGQFLETDANSRARVQVANIGQVEVAPNSRVKLIRTGSAEHRLGLERGILQARIFAPPRLFIVDTPSAVAVDLGCEYTLEVDADGNSRLRVTAGYVALERGGRESIVPAGAVCLTKRGKGLGTPFSDDASAEFQNALYKFDFQNGGSESLRTIVKESNVYDAPTLWHLLSRTQRAEREKVFDALASFVKLPNGATREGVLRLNKKMLDAWWAEIENVWFG